jgi:hypothetical protein
VQQHDGVGEQPEGLAHRTTHVRGAASGQLAAACSRSFSFSAATFAATSGGASA